MNFPIKLVKNVEGAKGAGGRYSDPVSEEFNLFAELLEPSSAFRTYDAQTQLGQVKRFRIRFRDELSVNGNWKIEFRGKEWTIISIEQEKERMFYWLITARHK